VAFCTYSMVSPSEGLAMARVRRLRPERVSRLMGTTIRFRHSSAPTADTSMGSGGESLRETWVTDRWLARKVSRVSWVRCPSATRISPNLPPS